MEIGVTSHGDSLQLEGTYAPTTCFRRGVVGEDLPQSRNRSKRRTLDAVRQRKPLRPRGDNSPEQTVLAKAQGVGTFVIHVPHDGNQGHRDARRDFYETNRSLPLHKVLKDTNTPYRYPAQEKGPVTSGRNNSPLWDQCSSTVKSHEDVETKDMVQQEDRAHMTLPIIQHRRRLLAAQRAKLKIPSQQQQQQQQEKDDSGKAGKPATPGLYGQGIEALQHFSVPKRQRPNVSPTTKISHTPRHKPNNFGTSLPQEDEEEKGRFRRKCSSLPSIHSANFDTGNSLPSLRAKSKGDVSLPDLSSKVKLPDIHRKPDYDNQCHEEEVAQVVKSSRSEPVHCEDDRKFTEHGSTSRPKRSMSYNLRDMTVHHHQRMIDSQISASDTNIKLWVDRIRDNNVVVDNSAYEVYARKPVSKYSLSKVNVTMAMSNVANRAYRLKVLLGGLDSSEHDDDGNDKSGEPVDDVLGGHSQSQDPESKDIIDNNDIKEAEMSQETEDCCHGEHEDCRGMADREGNFLP